MAHPVPDKPALTPLAKALQQARKAARLTQAEVATRVGVTKGAVSQWEAGLSTPTDENTRGLAALYGIPAGALRFGDGAAAVPAQRAAAKVAEGARRRLPPRVYERLYGYLERLERAGADEEQLDEAERIILQERYAKLNKATRAEPTEEQLLVDVDAGWAAVWEVLTSGGMRIPGPRPRFGKAEEGA